MDFLLALVAPVLTKVLSFVYLSGVATSFHLRLRGRKQVHGLPPLPSRGLRSRASAGEAKPHTQVQTQGPQQARYGSQLSKPAFSRVQLTGQVTFTLATTDTEHQFSAGHWPGQHSPKSTPK